MPENYRRNFVQIDEETEKRLSRAKEAWDMSSESKIFVYALALAQDQEEEIKRLNNFILDLQEKVDKQNQILDKMRTVIVQFSQLQHQFVW